MGRIPTAFLGDLFFSQKILVPDDYPNSRMSQNPCPCSGSDLADTAHTSGMA